MSKPVLHSYQRAFISACRQNLRYGGMACVMGTGTGKTISAVFAALQLLAEKKVTNVVVVAPKAVEPQFRSEVKKFDSAMEQRWQLGSYERFKRGHLSFDSGTLLILDEAHNLRNSSNKTAQAVAEAAKKVKFVIALTATPMVNGPQDLYMLLKILSKGKHIRNMPSTQMGWEKKYGFDIATCGKGKEVVTQAFRKHMHYFFKEQSEDFPRRRLLTGTDVDLHRRQTKAMIELTRKENASKTALAMLKKLGGDFSSVDDIKTAKNLNAYLNKARQAALIDYGQSCSTKVQAIVQKIRDGPKPAVVFVEFRSTGIDQINRCLKRAKLRVQQMNGSMSKSQRFKVQNAYNNKEIDVLLITKAAAEGVDLKRSRQFHLVAPTWNDALVQQAEGRTIRYKSHSDLPKKDRVVDVYNWVAVPDEQDEMEIDREKTGGARVEQRLQAIALRKKKLIEEYMVALQQAAQEDLPEFEEATPAVPDELDAAAVVMELVRTGVLEKESKQNIAKLAVEAKSEIDFAAKHGTKRRRSAQRASAFIRKVSRQKKKTATKATATRKKKAATKATTTKKTKVAAANSKRASSKSSKCPPFKNSKRRRVYKSKGEKNAVCASDKQIRYYKRGSKKV
jgi:superfamily II DNA or RNA helicase